MAQIESNCAKIIDNDIDVLQQLKDFGLWQEGIALRLHLGCGERHFDGYINIDYPQSEHNLMRVKADVYADIKSLDFPLGSVDEIRLHHVFEHFSRVTALAMLIKWNKWLKIGGRLHIETPDLIASARMLVSDTSWKIKMGVVRHLAGDQAANWGYHIDHWFPERFEHTLRALGFGEIQTLSSSWSKEPYLSNVTVVAVKSKPFCLQEQLKVAEELLLESTVAQEERPTWEAWKNQLRAALAGDSVPLPGNIQTSAKREAVKPGKVNTVREQGDLDTQLCMQPESESLVVNDWIGEGDIVFDVGANVGSKTDVYLMKGAHVVCFEPQPECVRVLREKYQNNQNVTIVDNGLAGEAGQMQLSICSKANTISTFSDEWKTGRFTDYSWDRVIPVEVTTLDEMIEVYGRPKFCKIDVEGFELAVLKGLSQPVPYIAFEFAIEFLENARKCLLHLQALGYKHFNLCLGERPEFVFSEWVSSEMLFHHIEHLDNELLWGDIYAKANDPESIGVSGLAGDSVTLPGKTNLDGNGERVDIFYKGNTKFDELDIYQKSHCRRYEYAKSIISPGKVVGDFACGTGYGSVMLAEKSNRVIGVDIDEKVIKEIRVRYKNIQNIEFVHANLLDLKYQSLFDYIVSFETVEHLTEDDIPKLFRVFSRALKPGGTLIFSTPYMQERSPEAINMGFHSTFYIDEEKIKRWLSANGLAPEFFKYQNYQTHNIENHIDKKDFIICAAHSCKNVSPKKQIPKVSILIPTFNRVNYLKIAIDSALNQTYSNIEILVLDDCSTDETIKLSKAYSDIERITFVRNEENIGFIKNWNKAVSLSSGEYIKIIGDDDILENNCVAEQVKILNEHPDVGVVCCNCFIVDEDSNIKNSNNLYKLFNESTKENGEEFIKNYLLGKRPVGWPAAILFRRDDINKAGDFDTAVGCAADIDMWCRILKSKNFYYLDQMLAYCRQWSGNLSAKLEANQLGHKDILYFYFKTVPYIEHRLDEATKQRISSALIKRISSFHTRATAENKKIIEHDIDLITERFQSSQKQKKEQTQKDSAALIFSKDRAMQLRATIESFLLHCKDSNNVHLTILYKATTPLHKGQYDDLKKCFEDITFIEERDFRQQTLQVIEAFKYILFMVDDDIYTRDFYIGDVTDALDREADAIGFSLRLGENTTYCYMLNSLQKLPPFEKLTDSIVKYDWTAAERDFGYPLEVSSSVYRSKEMLDFLSERDFSNPNELESQMASNRQFENSRPMLLCCRTSVTFCNPANKVQNVYEQNRSGINEDYSPERLAQTYQQGMIIDISKYTSFVSNAVHQEVDFYFKKAGDNAVGISVIVPCYNQARYLPEAVESIINQTYKNWECVIVNDCSTDNTVEVTRQLIEKYPNHKIRLIDKPQNTGLADTRNTAILAAVNEWILPLDSDDMFEPTFMQKAVDIIQQEQKVDIVFASLQEFGTSNGEWVPAKYSRSRVMLENTMPYASLYRKELWRKVGGYDNLLSVIVQPEDWNFWIGCSKHNPVVKRIEEKLFLYRINPQSMYHKTIKHNRRLAWAFIATCHPDLYTVTSLVQAWQVIANCPDSIYEEILKAIEKYPERGLPYFWRGLIRRRRGQVSEAFEDYKAAVEKAKKDDWQGLFALMMLQKSEGDLVGARSSLEKLLSIRPDFDRVPDMLPPRVGQQKILFYYDRIGNISETSPAGTVMAVLNVARMLRDSHGIEAHITGNLVTHPEQYESLHFVPLPQISEREQFLANYDVVFFATHIRHFKGLTKPQGQIWILWQHCWQADDLVSLSHMSDFDIVVCLSELHRASLHNHGIGNEKFLIIPNPIDTDVYSPKDVERDNHSIMYAGALHPHKCVHILMDAFRLVRRQISDAELHIYGDGSMWRGGDAYGDNLKSTKPEGTYFHGYVNNKDMPEIYSKHSLLVLPSKLETFPMVILESQACGCIPAAHDAGGTAATLADGRTGLLYLPNTPEKLAETIIAGLKMVDADPSIRHRAVDFVRENFSTDKAPEYISKLWDRINIAREVNTIEKLLENNDTGQADLECEQLLQKYPNHPDVLLLQANVLKANAQIEELLEKFPNHVKALNDYGLMAMEAGDTKNAFRYFTKAYKFNPWDRNTITNCYAILKASGKYRQAKTLLLNYLANVGEDAQVLQMLGEIDALVARASSPCKHGQDGRATAAGSAVNPVSQQSQKPALSAVEGSDVGNQMSEATSSLVSRPSSLIHHHPLSSVLSLHQDSTSGPPVSIIMPVYNGAEYIGEAIKSVLIQDYPEFELIIIDDGSTDNTSKVISCYDDGRIGYFYQENGGMSNALNHAVRRAKGQYIMPLDADDVMTQGFIAKHLAEFEKHPEADLVYCDVLLIDADGEPIKVMDKPEYQDRRHLIRDLFRHGHPIVPFRLGIRRSVYDKIGLYDEKLIVGMDYDMMRRFVKAGLKEHHLRQALHLRRMHPESLSRTINPDKVRSHFEVLKRFTDTFSCDELFPDVAWDKIPPDMRQLHAKCLIALTYLAIGQEHIKSNLSPVYAKMAFEQACSELNDCLEIDPNNQRVRQLLQKCELGRQKYDEKILQAV